MKDKFQLLAYTFYPKGICSMKDKEEYLNSLVFKNLIDEIENDKNDNILNKFKVELEEQTKRKIYDFSLFSWYDRAYNIQFIIDSSESITLVFCINISKIIKYYTCYILEIKKEHKKEMSTLFPKRNIKLLKDEKTYNHIIFPIKKLIENSFYFEEFPKEILYENISDLNFQDIEMSNFTFFNAFFLNNYHTEF